MDRATTEIPRSARRRAQDLVAPRKVRAKKNPPLPMPDVLYSATTQPDVVTVPARRVIACEGEGAPESDAFREALGALYGVAYTLKFGRKRAGAADFKIGPLEGHWSAAMPGKRFVQAPRATWRWKLRIAVPSDVTRMEFVAAVKAVTTKKGGKLENSAVAKRVELERIGAQRVGRALHKGPYSEEGRTLDAIGRAMAREDLKPSFSHIEVYLNDPRRTAPERLKTVLLREAR